MNQYLLNFNQACHHYKGMVVSSETFQAQLLSKYGITAAELIRPFFKQPRKARLKLGLKDRESEFGINLLDIQEYDQIGNSKLDKYSRIVLEESQADIVNIPNTSKWGNRKEVDQIYEGNKMNWLHNLQQVVADCVSYNYHLNFLDQPIVIIYMVSGQEINVMKEIETIKLSSEKLIQRIFQNNSSDKDVLKRVILVMNDQQAVAQFEKIELINKDFPNHNPRILKYNISNPIEQTLWSRFATKRYFIDADVPKNALAILDEQWTKQYRQVFDEMILNLILPNLERFINILTQQYLEMKQKTLDNLFGGFFRRAESGKFETDYQMSQKEYLMRFLGDHHFLMQDYDSAAQYYKAYNSEVKNNKTNTQIPVLIGQEYYLYARILSQQKVDNMWGIFDEIQTGFQKCPFPFMLRLMYNFIYCVQQFGRYNKDSIFFLQRCLRYFKEMGALQKPDHFTIYQTLANEQLSFLHLKLDPPQYRKFAHNLTLVAAKYEQENFKRNSLRSYKTVESIYLLSKWTGVLFWLEGHIGANYMDNKKVVEAIDAFKQAFNLLNERQQIDLHNQLVTDWKKTYSAIELVPNYQQLIISTKQTLFIPQLKGPVDILTTNWENLQSIYANYQKSKPKTQWSTLTRDQSFFEDAFTKCLDTQYLEDRISCFNKIPSVLNIYKQSDLADKFDKFGRHAFVGDKIKLRFFANIPLKVASNISNLKINYEYYIVEQSDNLLDLDEASSPTKQVQLQQVQLPADNIQIVNLQYNKATQEYVEVWIELNRPGYIIITGLQWQFLNIPTVYPLEYNMKDQSKKKSVNFYNKFKIFPKFDPITIHFNPKAQIAYGEVSPILFTFTNNHNEDIDIQINPIIPYHFGFEEKHILIPANQSVQEYIYIRCSFQEDFVGQLLIRYQSNFGGRRIHKVEIPMKHIPSFKIMVQTDLTAYYWKFTLQIQDYFNSKGELKLNRILCLNENWQIVGETFLSTGESFLLATFQIMKSKFKKYDSQEIQQRLKKQFYRLDDKYNQILFTDEQNINHEITTNFVNLDIRHYFNIQSDKIFSQEFPLFIIACWTHRDGDDVTIGIHELPIITQKYFHKSPNELPLTLQFETIQSIAFDFNKSMICKVPVKVTFKNTKFMERIRLKATFYNGDEPVKNNYDLQQPSFLWDGQLIHEFELEYEEQFVLETYALFTEPGVYDLSRIRIFMKETYKDYYSMDYDQVIIKVL